MQGPGAVVGIVEALAELEGDPAVDVIVLARGGGSVEDLLPFSDEVLCRAVAGCRTPTVSAIGHEPDAPLLDFIADLRCSTPTDAGKRIVPAVREENERIQKARAALRRGVSASVRAETLHTRQLTDRARRRVTSTLEAGRAETGHLLARVRALSPRATLERGYAVVLRDGLVVRSVTGADAGDRLDVRLADGSLESEVLAVTVSSPA